MIIFGEEAPKYWEKNLPVIPLRINSKAPFQNDWARFCVSQVPEDLQESWLNRFKINNIGLPCGPASGLIMVDYDYEDARVEKAVLSVLPNTPWVRTGRKGWVRAFRYNGTHSKKIHDEKHKPIVEIISTGGQVVLPHSIHPDTRQPYVSNCNLYDVIDQIPMLPDDIEQKLRTAIAQVIPIDENTTKGKFRAVEYVPSGARDVQMNRYAGLLANSVLKAEINLKQAMEFMMVWFDINVEKKDQDSIDINKGLGQIIQYLLRDVYNKGKILPPGWDDDISEEDKKRWGLEFKQEHEEWEFDKIVDYIEKVYKGSAENSPERMTCIDFILNKIHRSTKLNWLETEKVLKYLVASESDVTLATLKKQLKALEAGPIEGISHFEIAQQVMKEMNESYGKIVFDRGTFWCWEGSHWTKLEEHHIRKYIQEEYGSLAASRKSSDYTGIVKVCADLVPQRLKENVQVTGVNFANGFLNQDLELLPHAPEFGMTYILPFCYEPKLAGKCPKFFTFLMDCWGHMPDFEDKKTMLQEAISVTLFGAATSYQRAFLLQGEGNTGKSVLMKIISHLVPDNAKTASPPEKWDENYQSAQFLHSLLNQAGELSDRKLIDGKTFKEIVAGDAHTARNIYGEPFSFYPKTAHWFASNPLPRSTDHSNAFIRRWLIFTFDNVIPSEKIIRDLDELIAYEEMDGIVAWALEAWPALRKRGDYTFCASHKNVIETMRYKNSQVRQWMRDRLRRSENGKVKERDLYLNFWNYVSFELNSKAIPPSSFSFELNQFLNEDKVRDVENINGVNYYKGFILLEKNDG